MGIVVLFFWILPLTGDGPIWNFGMNLLVPVCKDPFSLFSSFAYFSNYNTKTGQDIFKFDTSFSVVSLYYLFAYNANSKYTNFLLFKVQCADMVSNYFSSQVF